ncbi:MAG: response regulator [Eubacteriales bacterium]|nr:response regulator [Eubacteriales bacterium]
MYRILLVDDERPALNFLNAIVTKYLPDFEIAGLAEDAPSAIALLEKQAVDVLVTDVSMPGDMNGIDLTKAAREIYPELHIVIVSGYAEFEYARGAIQAGVEDYLLKPISISRVKEVLMNIKALLDDEHIPLLQRVFTDLLRQREPKPEELERAFGSSPFMFAFARIGNLNSNRFAHITSIGPDTITQPGWQVFCGRDENEFIILHANTHHNGNFPQLLSEWMNRRARGRAWTAVYEGNASSLKQLVPFLQKANKQLNETLIIGNTQCLSIGNTVPKTAEALPANIRRQLSACVMSCSWRVIQDLFLSLAVEWEKARLPQEQVEQHCYQLINQTFDESGLNEQRSMQEIHEEVNNLFAIAGTVGELLSGLYGVLFGDLSEHDKQISGDELCAYTLDYIKKNFNKALNVQSICAKTGFSQTYLSRLLRKYANTSVNTYLTQCRMEAAKQLLNDNPNMLLRDVATLIGYEDQSYFNKIFRNETGMTPRQYASQFIK